MGGLILGVNTLYRVVCFFKLFIIGGKGLTYLIISFVFECTELGTKSRLGVSGTHSAARFIQTTNMAWKYRNGHP